MKRTFSSFERVLSDVTHRVSNVGQIVLMVMVLLVIVDVTLRRVFNRPFPWSLEVVQVMLVVVIFFSIAYCGVKKAHVSIDALISKFPPKVQVIIDVITYSLGVLLFAFMTWGGAVSAMGKWHTHYITGILPIPIYPFSLVVAFGSALLALVLLVQLLNLIINRVSK
jgi:TRAP-type C4-dicarboxylate transport system permease small subunit